MKNSEKTFAIVILIIGLISLSFGVYELIFSSSNDSTDSDNLNKINDDKTTTSIMEKNTNIIEETNLYTNNDVEVKVLSAIPKENYVEIKFSLHNKSNAEYNFSINKMKINNCITTFGEPSSNFSGVNLGVKPNETSDNYIIYVWYKDLDLRSIKDISTVSFKLQLFKNIHLTKDFDTYTPGYIDIKTKYYDEKIEFDNIYENKDKLYSDEYIDIYSKSYKINSESNTNYIIVHNKSNKSYQLEYPYMVVNGKKIKAKFYNIEHYIFYDNSYDLYAIPEMEKSIPENSKSVQFGFDLYDFDLYDFSVHKVVKQVLFDIKQ